MKHRKKSLNQIVAEMKRRQKTEGVARESLGRGLHLLFKSDKIALIREGVYPSEQEVEIVLRAFGLSESIARTEKASDGRFYVWRGYIQRTSSLGFDLEEQTPITEHY